MSDRHPRPWTIGEVGGWIIDAEDDVVAYELGDDNDRPTAELIVAAVNAHSPWISVEDRLPEESDIDNGVLHEVLATDGFNRIVATYRHGRWLDDEGCSHPIRHWMPLPAPPA